MSDLTETDLDRLVEVLPLHADLVRAAVPGVADDITKAVEAITTLRAQAGVSPLDGTKSFGERLYLAEIEAFEWSGDPPFAKLDADLQAGYDRAAVNFVARLSDAAALSDRDARIAELEEGLREIDSLDFGVVGQIARALLTPTGTEIKDE